MTNLVQATPGDPGTVPYQGQTEYHQDFGTPRSYNPDMDVGLAVRQAKEAGLVNVGGIDPLAEAQAARIAEAVGSGQRAFISPMNKTAKIMVKGGVMTPCYPNTDNPIVPGAPSAMGVEMRRLGDVFVEFEGGMCILDPNGGSDGQDTLRIMWCEANPQITRDCLSPEVEQWSAMKEGQLNTSIREPSLDPGMDVDRVLAGDWSAFSNAGSLAARARAILAGS